jgi:hypothetical protein
MSAEFTRTKDEQAAWDKRDLGFVGLGRIADAEAGPAIFSGSGRSLSSATRA